MFRVLFRAIQTHISAEALVGLSFLASVAGCQAAERSPPQAAADTNLPPAETSLPEGAQAVSLLGDTLFAPEPAADVREERERRLAEAREAYENDPNDADAIIWLGRRTAYTGDYRAAIRIYDEGISKYPQDPRFLRHRGHRFITTRQLERAIADLEQAASLIEGTPDEVEPDGLPNARNIPTSTLQSNVWYHLGLAHYLRGDLERALAAYRECLEVSRNPDMLVATSHWLYMTLRRLGRETDATEVLAPIRADLDVIENHAYHRLLLMYRGELAPDDLWAEGVDALGSATLGYGIANWHLYNGRTAEGRRALERVLETGEWAAFGYLAAEAETARLAREN